MSPEEPHERSTKPPIPARCARCGGSLNVDRSRERVLIRCEQCGTRIFAYYAAPPTPESGDAPPTLSTQEDDLLKTVGPQARMVYVFLCAHIIRRGYAPTVREMMQGLDLHSANTIAHHLDRLEACGLIERAPGRARAIRLTRSP